MALPQGINFRDTAGYVTDNGAQGDDKEIGDAGHQGPSVAYPHTSAQGNNVGWESALAQFDARDRVNTNDRRLAGVHYQATTQHDYRIDLPSAADYSVRIAAGDGSYTITTKIELLDTTTSLGVLCNGSTGAANSFFDAGGTIRTAANWPGQNTLVTKTFATTICRFRCGTGAIDMSIAHVYVEAAPVAVLVQTHYRWRNDDGALSEPL